MLPRSPAKYTSPDGRPALAVHNCVIEDNEDYGILAYRNARVYVDSATVIRGNDIGVHALPNGAFQGTTVELDSCTIEDNRIGVYVYNLDNVTVNNCEIVDNYTNGFLCSNTADITISANTIDGNLVGIKCYNNSAPQILADNTFSDNTTGLKCDQGSDPRVQGNRFEDNGKGVDVLGQSLPDLGGGASGSTGYNWFVDNSTLDVRNLNTPQTSTWKVYAEVCTWSDTLTTGPWICTCMPDPDKLTGLVSVCPAECEDPALLYSPGLLPAMFDLSQNYPNPFNPVTTIKYQIPRPGAQVSILIYNVQGQLVRKLVSEFKTPGFYSVEWKGRSDQGSSVASGVYFVRMVSGRFAETKKVVLLK